ncbi:recombinase family protein [Patulibacter sp.]|uniref:recombinase family protein n=1 Tax=Patulibacter sp. TaxID=1912859 RepID=UPI00271EC93E|nr:recombinase family protein [Patulibacter sp.]MDO9409692.1 recombinase family protein [Patulibacter sp.]
MRVIGYLRVSTNEQADSGAGIAAQRSAISAEAARRGWDVEFIEDLGFSAKSMKRPALQAALGTLGRGDVLLVSKMDRLSRSMLDFCTVMQRAQREGWALVALDCPADLTTPSGEAMASIMAAFSQLERRLIGERTKAALAERKAAGVRLGRERVISTDVETRAKALRASGLSIRKVGAALDAEGLHAPGGKPWHAASLSRVLARA